MMHYRYIFICTIAMVFIGCTLQDGPPTLNHSQTPLPTHPVIYNNNTYQELTVMADPLPQYISAQDIVYKDGYAKFYTFTAQKDQSLVAIAEEDRNSTYSYIKTELYDFTGKILYDRDTRIEFNAPYTGNYYYIVRTFGNQEGAFAVKIFDQNLTRDRVYAQIQNGEEKQLSEGGPTETFTNVQAITVEFISPIEVKNQNTILYYNKGEQFSQATGVEQYSMNVYSMPNLNMEQTIGGLRTRADRDQFKLDIETEKVGSNKVRITRSDKRIFEQNHVVMLEWHYPNGSYANGFFTGYE